jgi:putative acetyltransferase
VTEGAALRAITDADAEAVTSLVGRAYAEHDGCVLDLPGVDADLLEPASAAARRGGRWWVVEDDGRVVASVGTGPRHDDGLMELKRLYVAASHRRRGWARSLVARVEAHAAGHGVRAVELWSDTRFADAHALYAELGYVRTGDTRRLHDPSDTTEYRFTRALPPRPPAPRSTWTGPFGLDTCHLVELPDGWLLHGQVGRISYRVEVDDAWRTRGAEVVDPSGTRRLTSDGDGRWWREGSPATGLSGCLDVAVEATPATAILPIRRAGRSPIAADAAWFRVPGPGIEPRSQHYAQLADDRWTCRTEGSEGELTLDPDGLPSSYGDRWRRV